MAIHAINSKQRKEVTTVILDAYGAILPKDNVLFLLGEDKYYLGNREVEPFLATKLRIERIGVYIGQFQHGEFRLSIEGSQIIGALASKGIITLTSPQRNDWLLGKDVQLVGDDQLTAQPRFHIVRCGVDWLGAGKVKNGMLLNYVPKERYVGATFESENDVDGLSDDDTP